VDSSAKDIKVRKAQAWTATLKLDNIWKSNPSSRLKINFFRATVESILLYGAETWTMTKELNKELDGTYTRLLRHALNIDWRQHIANEELYGDLPRISETIKKRRLRLAGHCWRSNEAAANLVLWKPQHGQKKPGRPKLDYATLLSEDAGLNLVELGTTMSSRECWRTVVMVRVRPINDDHDSAEGREGCGRCDVVQQTVPDLRGGNRKSPAADCV